MTNTTSTLAAPPDCLAPQRYQIYRQARNGLHYHHGPSIESPEDAVALFLQTTPVFEGGGIRLWDRYEQRAVATAEWNLETTGMGFHLRTRSDVFHDAALGALARHMAQREALVEAIARDLRASVSTAAI
jgi:hypothetical protein